MIPFEQQEVISAFPTAIFKGRVTDKNTVSDLKHIVLSLRNDDAKDLTKGWQSSDMLQDEINFQPLCDLILAQSNQILNYYKVIRDSHYITNMWANVSNANTMHMIHMHPNSFLSGCLYLNTPENCGPIIFSDPRYGSQMLEVQYEEINQRNATTFLEIPEEGMMLMWPSWLPHGVEHGYSVHDDYRISIAFNIMIKGTVELPTKRLILT